MLIRAHHQDDKLRMLSNMGYYQRANNGRPVKSKNLISQHRKIMS